MNTPEGGTLQTTFTSAIPVLPATNMDQALVFTAIEQPQSENTSQDWWIIPWEKIHTTLH